MSTLSQSYIFNMFNINKTMSTRIAEAYRSGQVITSSYIEEQILQIKRTRISPIADAVLKAFDDGKITLIYSKLIKIPKAIPFVILKTNGRNQAVIFVNNYGSIVENELVEGGTVLNIGMKDLYVLMEGAFLAYTYYEYPTRMERSIGLMKLSNSIYTSMILRILNKDRALSMDQELYSQVSFCVSRFYLEKVWENKNHDLVFGYAMSTITNPNRASLTLVDDQYTAANIEQISDLFRFLEQLAPRMEGLTIRYFTEYYINTYRDTAVLSMDVFPYFLFVLVCAYCGSFLVNQPVINDIIKTTKNANIFYSEIAKVI